MDASHNTACTPQPLIIRFIHATFGEFLAARIIAHQLTLAADVMRLAPPYDKINAEQHARLLLIPYLAQRPLVNERQVLLFLEDILGGLVANRNRQHWPSLGTFLR